MTCNFHVVIKEIVLNILLDLQNHIIKTILKQLLLPVRTYYTRAGFTASRIDTITRKSTTKRRTKKQNEIVYQTKY